MRARRSLGSFVVVSLALALASGCVVYRSKSVRGSGQIVSEQRTIEPFSELELRGSADIVLTSGDAPTLTLESDDNILPLIRTEVRNGRLVISSRGSYSSRHGVLIRAQTPELRAVAISGAGTIRIEELDGEQLETTVFGSGDIEATGRVDRLVASIKGSGDADFSRLEARAASVSITGSGDIDLLVSESLDAEITGSGDITYRGDPVNVSKRIIGSGDIEPR